MLAEADQDVLDEPTAKIEGTEPDTVIIDVEEEYTKTDAEVTAALAQAVVKSSEEAFDFEGGDVVEQKSVSFEGPSLSDWSRNADGPNRAERRREAKRIRKGLKAGVRRA